jgi:hypothetical protein
MHEDWLHLQQTKNGPINFTAHKIIKLANSFLIVFIESIMRARVIVI